MDENRTALSWLPSVMSVRAKCRGKRPAPGQCLCDRARKGTCTADSEGCFERRGMIQNVTGEGRGFISEGEVPRSWALRLGRGSET